MPRKKQKKSTSPCIASDELPTEHCIASDELSTVIPVSEDQLTLKSLYELVIAIHTNQNTFMDKITSIVAKLEEASQTREEASQTRSNNWIKYVEETWKNISSGLVLFGKKLEYLEKRFKETNSRNINTREHKVVVKGIPAEIGDEQLPDFVSMMLSSLDKDIKDFKAERIVINGKPGPVSVIFDSEDDLSLVLKKKHELKESIEFRTIFVSPWLSKQQRRTDFNIRQLAKVNSKTRFSGGRVHIKP